MYFSNETVDLHHAQQQRKISKFHTVRTFNLRLSLHFLLSADHQHLAGKVSVKVVRDVGPDGVASQHHNPL